MQHLFYSIPYPEKDLHVVRKPDPLIVGSSSHTLGVSEHIFGQSLHPQGRSSD
jgi:hypothetical protein